MVVVIAVGVVDCPGCHVWLLHADGFLRSLRALVVLMFTSGAMVMLPSLAQSVLGRTNLTGWGDFLQIGNHTIWTG